MLAAAGMQQEAPEAPQETESMQAQSSTDEAASAARGTAAESSTAAASRLGGKSSWDVHGPSVDIVDGTETSHTCAEGNSNMSFVLSSVQTGRDTLVHAIFRSYLSVWKEKHDSYSTDHDQGDARDTWKQSCCQLKSSEMVMMFQLFLGEEESSYHINRSYEGLQPWPPPCSLRTSCLSGRGVVLWTWVHSIKGRSSSVEGVHEREI